jgi:hypothetical protein
MSLSLFQTLQMSSLHSDFHLLYIFISITLLLIEIMYREGNVGKGE